MLHYCAHIVFYVLLKAEGRPVRDHPVMQRSVVGVPPLNCFFFSGADGLCQGQWCASPPPFLWILINPSLCFHGPCTSAITPRTMRHRNSLIAHVRASHQPLGDGSLGPTSGAKFICASRQLLPSW
eukprot:scaffold128227_cov18-Tisochrysis_lutea.AAC.1